MHRRIRILQLYMSLLSSELIFAYMLILIVKDRSCTPVFTLSVMQMGLEGDTCMSL